MLKAVIFDMDGVIVDSEPLHHRAIRETFLPYDVDIRDEELYSYIGIPSRIVIQDTIERFDLDVGAEKLIQTHKSILKDLYSDSIPISGVLELVEIVHDSDVKLGLASSTDLDLIRVVLDRLALDAFFDTVVSVEEVEHPKPMPDVYLEAARRLDCEPKTCLAIEDSQAGVQSAKGAGMRCLGFSSPNSPHQDLHQADMIFGDLWELELSELKGLMDKR